MFDKAGRLQPRFVFLNGFTGRLEPVNVDSMEVYNSLGTGSTAKLYGTPGGGRLANLAAESLFPFAKSKYTVFAGSCSKNNPDPGENTPANDAALGFALVPPGGEAAPQIQLPSLDLTVTFETAPLKNAAVALTDNQCTTKRTYRTNGEGHLAASEIGPTESGLPWSNYKLCIAAQVKGRWYRFEKTPYTVQNLSSGTAVNVSLSSEATSTSTTTELKC
jgi:hypothetical protein